MWFIIIFFAKKLLYIKGMPYFQTKPHGILRHMTPELCSSLIVDCEVRTVQTQETAQDISETSILPVVWV